MTEPIRRLQNQLARMESERKRDHEHFLLVMATQRERIDKAFSEVSLALLEQELAVRQRLTQSDEAVTRLGASVLESLTRHDARLSDIEDRLRRLEGAA